MTQIRIVALSIYLILSNILFGQSQVKIIGNTTNADGKYLYVGYENPGLKDSVLIQNDKFEYSFPFQEPVIFYLSQNKDFLFSETEIKSFYVEPGHIEFQFNYEDLSTIEIKGVRTEDEAAALRKLRIPITTIWKENSEHLSMLYQNLEKENNVTEKQKIQIEIDRFEAKDDSLKLELGRIGLEFVKLNPSSFLCPAQLHYALTRKGAEIYFDEIKTAYQNLDQTIKTSSQSENLLSQIENFEKSSIGVISPNFKMKDWLGKERELKDFKGKYVLLDFWASWCKPCLEDFPHLKSLYSEYHEKGFEIIQISQDKDMNKWKSAIENYQINNWIHFSSHFNQSNVEGKFFVGAIPVKILIGPDGKILQRWRGGGPPNQQNLTQTLEDIFN
ncbi:MAG TPA: thioredoxin-like domain-containing protein [Moheibacter sp.]|nr:thioredoxin-like domain-containing protein [Moheibacter sp.]